MLNEYIVTSGGLHDSFLSSKRFRGRKKSRIDLRGSKSVNLNIGGLIVASLECFGIVRIINYHIVLKRMLHIIVLNTHYNIIIL